MLSKASVTSRPGPQWPTRSLACWVAAKQAWPTRCRRRSAPTPVSITAITCPAPRWPRPQNDGAPTLGTDWASSGAADRPRVDDACQAASASSSRQLVGATRSRGSTSPSLGDDRDLLARRRWPPPPAAAAAGPATSAAATSASSERGGERRLARAAQAHAQPRALGLGVRGRAARRGCARRSRCRPSRARPRPPRSRPGRRCRGAPTGCPRRRTRGGTRPAASAPP